MPVFVYTVHDLGGKESFGTITADTPAQGRERLRERGLRIQTFASSRPSSAKSAWRIGLSRRRNEQVAEVARYLALLLRAGVTITDALEVITRRRTGRLTLVLKNVRESVANGEALADALARHPLWFGPLFVSAVRMGQLSGNLDEALTELAEHLRASQNLRNQITAALTYPLIVSVVGLGVVLFLMTFVIPQLLSVLEASGRPLPASTTFLKSLSDLILNHGMLGLLILIPLAGASAALVRRPAIRRMIEGVVFRIPTLGPLLQKSLVAHFAQHMSLLLKTGISFVEAVQSVAPLTRSVLLSDELTELSRVVESGSDIAPALENSRVFPPVVMHLMAVGQDSGELPAMFAELRLRYEAEVRLAITRFTTMLEPLLIVVLASAVGFVVFACLMPILEATRAIA
ncbi:MAG: type II secretion system F family protein [Planctomycetota bacterium]